MYFTILAVNLIHITPKNRGNVKSNLMRTTDTVLMLVLRSMGHLQPGREGQHLSTSVPYFYSCSEYDLRCLDVSSKQKENSSNVFSVPPQTTVTLTHVSHNSFKGVVKKKSLLYANEHVFKPTIPMYVSFKLFNSHFFHNIWTSCTVKRIDYIVTQFIVFVLSFVMFELCAGLHMI